jgi:hypothetical protein
MESFMIDGLRPCRLIARGWRPEVGKSAERCRLQKFEVRNHLHEFLKPALPVGNLVVKEVMVMAVEGFPGQILIGAVSESDCGSRQEIVDPSRETRLFGLRGGQRGLDRKQDGPDALVIRLGVAIRRARFEVALRWPAAKISMEASP